MPARLPTLILAIAVAACGTTATTTTPAPTTPVAVTIDPSLLDIISLPDLGFEIAYPVDWTEASEVGVLGFYSPTPAGDNFAESFNVVVFPVPEDLPYDTYVQSDARTLSNNPNITILGSGNATLDGHPAESVVFSTTADNGAPITSLRVITLRGDRAYELSFFANSEQFDTYIPLFDELLSSFRWTEA